MATRGRPRKIDNQKIENVKTENSSVVMTPRCLCCGNDTEKNFYSSDSDFFKLTGKIPYCKKCIDKFYKYYYDKYQRANYAFPEKKAVKRLCMAFDIYYSDEIFESAVESKNKKNISDSSVFGYYVKITKLNQHKNKSYDTTIYSDEYKGNINLSKYDDNADIKTNKASEKTVKFFGAGFSDEDYEFLQEQYDDWTTRHECETKSQEEIFKRICFKQLEIWKATKRGEDTKNLDATFQSYLETAKLQPKQNSGDTTANTQTFGTLIDKWENTRPIPEIDEDLRDVDKIALYLDVFFKGHLAKMMGLKNGLSNLYTKYMKKYTVEKPEYNDNEDGEALFDAIFGNANNDDI